MLSRKRIPDFLAWIMDYCYIDKNTIFPFVEIKTCICNRRNLLSVKLLVKHVFVFKWHDDGTATKSLVLNGLWFCSPDYSGRFSTFLWAVNDLRGVVICENTVLALLLWKFVFATKKVDGIHLFNCQVHLEKNSTSYWNIIKNKYFPYSSEHQILDPFTANI